MKKRLFLVLLLVLYFVITAQTVSANALPYSWEGTTGSELFVMEDCPIQVSAEHLSFDLDAQKTGFTLRSAVTAAYSLYNPAQEPCTVSAVFPVITEPDDGKDTESQEILLDGEPIAFNLLAAPLSEEALLDEIQPSQLLTQGIPLEMWDTEENGEPQILLLDFQLTVAPKETAALEIHTITQAFMERDVVLDYFTTETRYTFHYFLSPAQYWDDFQNLTVDLHLSPAAPVLKDSSLDFQWVGGRRYRYQSDSLPEGELQFTVLSSVWISLLRVAALLALGIVLLFLAAKIRRRIKARSSTKSSQ